MDSKLEDRVLSGVDKLDEQPLKTVHTDANHNSNDGPLRGAELSENPPGQTPSEPRMDSGWSWLVLVGAFIVYFTALGSVSSLSVYLTVWMESFEASATTVGLVLSIHSLMRGMFGPICGMFCTKFGPRIVMVAGGLILTGGFIMAALSPTIEMLILSNGFVTALGASLSLSAVFQAMGMYFKTRFTFAVGVATSGISLGQLAFAPLYTFLIDLYGWRGSMLIVAAMGFHIVAAGALMRTNVAKTTRPHVPRSARPKHDLQSKNSYHEMETRTASETAGIVHGDMNQQYGVKPNLTLRSTGEGHGHDSPSYTTLSNGDITDKYAGSTEHKAGFPPPSDGPPCVAVDDDRADQTPIRESTRQSSLYERLLEYLFGFKYFLLETYGLRRLAHNTQFIILMIGAVCHGFGKLGVVYTVARAETIGIEPELASLLLSTIGAGSTFARVTHGWFIDKKYITAEMTYAWSMLLFSVTDVLTPWLVTFLPLVISSVFMGMAAGLTASVLIVAVRSFVEPSDASGAYGAQLFFWGLGDIIGVLVTGVVYDNLLSYDVAYFVGGGVLFVGSMLTFGVSISRRRNKPCKLLDAESTIEPPEETEIQAVYSGPSRLELGGAEQFDEDAGCVNPAYAVTDGEDISVSDVAVKTGLLMQSSENELRHIEGIVNPMTITQADF
ncbi:monocarboxylate transporter 5-like [Asterias rubens]|uniref:monocarboxylate transporter 5-like n=1 Tax=Asterias rubens TaxID=7604 RepID=UPI00145576F8|nr:monocarboxylate transporter 5-like [Asterias rubens]